MTSLLRQSVRGFTIVALTSVNVGQIAGGHYLGAFVIGFLISVVWWGNSRGAAHSTARFEREAYGVGAATGTIVGIWVTRMLYG